jgi:hypothetical protein
MPPTALGSVLSWIAYFMLMIREVRAEKRGVFRDLFGRVFDRFGAIVDVSVTVFGRFGAVFDHFASEVFEF